MPTEQEALEMLRSGEIQLPPLCLQLLETPTSSAQKRQYREIVQVIWRGHRYDFGLEIKSRSTPRIFQEALHQALNGSRPENTYPMLLLPYLSEEQLRELETRSVSGIDLCGNGVVVVPEALLVFRTGAPNKFRDSASIKNVYRGISSLVARSFLIQPQYASVNELHTFVKFRRCKPNVIPFLPEIAISTVSKALKGLEEDIIVGRESGTIKLLQPEKLLDKLVANYRPPEIKQSYQGKFTDTPQVVLDKLYRNAEAEHLRWVRTGRNSINYYGVMGIGSTRTLYCQNIARLFFAGSLPLEKAFHFPDIEVLETTDETVYFDSRQSMIPPPYDFYQTNTAIESIYFYSSPIQTYLEMMHGGPREKQTAPQIREFILKELAEKQA